MPAAPAADPGPLVLLHGDDDVALLRRAREVLAAWQNACPGAETETLDAAAANADEALRALARLREALFTLPFFGGARLVWFRGCTFFADDRTSEGRGVKDAVAALAELLKTFRWDGIRLLLTAPAVDRRKAFYKTVEKTGRAEAFEGLSAGDRDWADKAEALAAREFRTLGKRPTPDALAALVAQVGPNSRLLANECEKLALYAGDRAEITADDVAAVGVRAKHARAFALADAVGDRDLPRVLRTLDEELWAMRTDRDASEIGLLYGLIAKFRALLFARELLREGLLRPAASYGAFSAQHKALAGDRLANDPRFDPRKINAFVLFRASQQSSRWHGAELVRALGLLLHCNRQLVGSALDRPLILQRTLIEIVGLPGAARD
ncbi:MAG TPA: DNA polymerase III subunit delta [Verrucomicrobiota bacterium]|nr:DNA polymerase III subunit delta [Verrucomicrobiota bacterium]